MNTDHRRFGEQGYVVHRELFSPAEIEEFRAEAEAYRDHQGDLLSHPQLGCVVADARLLETIRLAGIEPPTYFGDSSVSFEGSSGFHRDNSDRTDPHAPDWQEGYAIVRAAIYLQDHSGHRGGLEVMPGSHRNPIRRHAGPVYLPMAPGDVVLWDLRLIHRGLAGGHLPPLPVERIALFICYGSPNRHLDRYISYLTTRAYQVRRWRNSRYSEAAIHAVSRAGLTVRPVPDLPADAGQNVGYVPIPY